MRQLLFLFRRTPYGSLASREGLDAVLAGAAFEIPMTLLFDGDGVQLLVQGQDAQAIGAKNVGAAFEALPMFDVEDLYVHGPSLARRGLRPEDLLLPVQVVDDAGMQTLLRDADQVLSF